MNTCLQREEELLSSWWKEYAECSEGPRGQSSSGKKLDMGEDSSTSKGSQSAQLYAIEEERVGVPVKGGLYEVYCSYPSFSLYQLLGSLCVIPWSKSSINPSVQIIYIARWRNFFDTICLF